jgi:hypothetical protein
VLSAWARIFVSRSNSIYPRTLWKRGVNLLLSASPERYTRRAWGLSAVGIPEKNRSTLCLVGLSCNTREGDMVLRLTYSIVKRGETTVPYCAAFAPLGSAPFVLGEIVSVQMPHQHRIL